MFRNYLAAAFRNLVRNRLYAGISIAGLAVAFASAILIGLYVRHELTYDRFVPGHDRVFLVNQRFVYRDKAPWDTDDTAAPLARDLKLYFPQIQYVARLSSISFPPAIRHGDVSISERGFAWADPDFFKVLPLPAVAGDPATALEAPDAVVLTRSAARKYFGQDAPLGGRLEVDGHPMRVAAVIEDLPSNSHLTGDVFASSKASFSLLRTLEKAGYTSNSNFTYVRLKPGSSAAAIDAALPDFVARRVQPAVNAVNPNRPFTQSMRLKPLTSIHLDTASSNDLKPPADVKVLAGLGIIGALIVIVAAINFVTLMTARASRRAMEVGVRKALGAERRDLVVQFMGEAMMHVAVALVLAVALAELLLPAVNVALQRKMAFQYLSDPGLMAAMLLVALVTALVAGVYPAFVLSSFRPATVLKGGPVASVSSGGGKVREALVVAQFAVLVTLLVSTVTIVRQTLYALRDATHVDKNGVMMLFASPCTDQLRDVIRAIPGVRGAACASPGAIGIGHSNILVNYAGRRTFLDYASVDFGFFGVYGVRPVAGRFFQSDRPGDDGGHLGGTAPTIVLNEAAVRALGFKSPAAAIGQSISWQFDPHASLSRIDGPEQPAQPSTVIGVAPDITFDSVRDRVDPGFYFVGPKNDVLNSVALNIRIDPRRSADTVRKIDSAWSRVSQGLPVQQYFADQFLLRLYIDNVIQGGFIAVCALIAISIACLGLFALSAFTAERRTKEIGVRKAMGASAADILKLLMWQFTRPVIWATVIAWPLAFFAMRWWLSSFAYRVGLAPWTFVAAGVAALVIAWATVFIHALKVARAKPVSALRYE